MAEILAEMNPKWRHVGKFTVSAEGDVLARRCLQSPCSSDFGCFLERLAGCSSQVQYSGSRIRVSVRLDLCAGDYLLPPFLLGRNELRELLGSSANCLGGVTGQPTHRIGSLDGFHRLRGQLVDV